MGLLTLGIQRLPRPQVSQIAPSGSSSLACNIYFFKLQHILFQIATSTFSKQVFAHTGCIPAHFIRSEEEEVEEVEEDEEEEEEEEEEGSELLQKSERLSGH